MEVPGPSGPDRSTFTTVARAAFLPSSRQLATLSTTGFNEHLLLLRRELPHLLEEGELWRSQGTTGSHRLPHLRVVRKTFECFPVLPLEQDDYPPVFLGHPEELGPPIAMLTPHLRATRREDVDEFLQILYRDLAEHVYHRVPSCCLMPLFLVRERTSTCLPVGSR